MNSSDDVPFEKPSATQELYEVTTMTLKDSKLEDLKEELRRTLVTLLMKLTNVLCKLVLFLMKRWEFDFTRAEDVCRYEPDVAVQFTRTVSRKMVERGRELEALKKEKGDDVLQAGDCGEPTLCSSDNKAP